MKTPRITDFDPEAKTPPLKSSMEKMPAIERPLDRKPLSQPPPTPVIQSRATPKPNHPKSRSLIRRTFDIYEDQLNYLTREALQDRLDGKEASMTAMVRQAIDEWIAKRKTRK